MRTFTGVVRLMFYMTEISSRTGIALKGYVIFVCHILLACTTKLNGESTSHTTKCSNWRKNKNLLYFAEVIHYIVDKVTYQLFPFYGWFIVNSYVITKYFCYFFVVQTCDLCVSSLFGMCPTGQKSSIFFQYRNCDYVKYCYSSWLQFFGFYGHFPNSQKEGKNDVRLLRSATKWKSDNRLTPDHTLVTSKTP